MTPQAAYEDLLKFLQEHSPSLALGSGGPENPDVQRVGISKDIADHFGSLAASSISPSDVELKPYETGYTPDPNEILYAPRSGNLVADLISAVEQVGELGSFDEDDEFVDQLFFYALVFSDGKKRTAGAFRKIGKQFDLTRSRRFIATFSRGTFDRIGRSVYAFDNQIDCVSWGDYVFIRNVDGFQKIFGYFEELRKHGEALATQLTMHIPFKNPEAFVEACQRNLPMVAKVQRIMKDPKVQTVPVTRIKEVGSDYEVDVPTVVEDETEKLVFEDEGNKRWNILKLLDHAFYHSDLTGDPFEANSKHRLSIAKKQSATSGSRRSATRSRAQGPTTTPPRSRSRRRDRA